MPSSSWWRKRAISTALLTVLLAALLALVNWRLPISIIDSTGTQQRVPLGTIWEAFFAHLPFALPGILARPTFLISLPLAALALAYIIVATLRLPADPT